MMTQRGVRYLSHPPGCGYGNSAVDYISVLRSAQVPVSWIPLVWGSLTWGTGHGLAPFLGRRYGVGPHDDICNASIGAGTTVVHSPPVWHATLRASEWGRRLVAYTTYEADRLPPDHSKILNLYDRVLVPSTLNAEVFQRSGVTVPIDVVPHIARPLRPVCGTNFSNLKPSTFVFYVIATWTARKALPDTIRAYLQAFTAADDVALVVKTTREDHVALRRVRLEGARQSRHEGYSWWTLARLLAGHSSPPPILLHTGDVDGDVIDELHARGNCFISLARGEGWGLGAFDAGRFGNPVVVTAWGGHLDFLPPEYPFLVAYRLVPTLDDHRDDWFEAAVDQRWAKADIACAAALLRRVYEERTEARRWGMQLRHWIEDHFRCDQVVPRLLRVLQPPQ